MADILMAAIFFRLTEMKCYTQYELRLRQFCRVLQNYCDVSTSERYCTATNFRMRLLFLSTLSPGLQMLIFKNEALLSISIPMKISSAKMDFRTFVLFTKFTNSSHIRGCFNSIGNFITFSTALGKKPYECKAFHAKASKIKSELPEKGTYHSSVVQWSCLLSRQDEPPSLRCP